MILLYFTASKLLTKGSEMARMKTVQVNAKIVDDVKLRAYSCGLSVRDFVEKVLTEYIKNDVRDGQTVNAIDNPNKSARQLFRECRVGDVFYTERSLSTMYNAANAIGVRANFGKPDANGKYLVTIVSFRGKSITQAKKRKVTNEPDGY